MKSATCSLLTFVLVLSVALLGSATSTEDSGFQLQNEGINDPSASNSNASNNSMVDDDCSQITTVVPIASNTTTNTSKEGIDCMENEETTAPPASYTSAWSTSMADDDLSRITTVVPIDSNTTSSNTSKEEIDCMENEETTAPPASNTTAWSTSMADDDCTQPPDEIITPIDSNTTSSNTSKEDSDCIENEETTAPPASTPSPGDGDCFEPPEEEVEPPDEEVEPPMEKCSCENLDYPAMDTIIFNHSKRKYKDAKLAIAKAKKGKKIVVRWSDGKKLILTNTSLVAATEECTNCTRFEIFGIKKKQNRPKRITIRCCGMSTHCALYRGAPKCLESPVGPPPLPPTMPPPQYVCANENGPLCDDWVWCSQEDESTCEPNQTCVFNTCPPPKIPKYCGLVNSNGTLQFCDWKTRCTDDPQVCPLGSECMENECSPML